MLRRSAVPTDTDASDLQTDAELAAKGDHDAVDRLFAALGGSAWGMAFSAADAVGPASEAVAIGFTEALQLFDSGLALDDVRTEVLHATRLAALAGVAQREAVDFADEDGVVGRHSREPVSLLGETNGRQSTLAFTALSEPMRSALWLVECEHLSVSRTARLIESSFKVTEDIVRQARSGFRRYYAEATRREGLSQTCVTAIDNFPAYMNRSLNAGDTAMIEQHLASCDGCRAIVLKLDDLEGCLRGAIPAVPAWTRQLVADQWAEIAPAAAEVYDREPRVWWLSTSRHPRVFAGVAAAVVVFGAIALLGRLGSDSDAASQLAASDTTQMDRAFHQSVSTLAISSTVPPATEVAPTTAALTIPETTVVSAPEPTTTAVDARAAAVSTTTTTAPRRTPIPVASVIPAPTTTSPPTTPAPTVPPTTTSLTLVDLPPPARLITPAAQ